MIRARTNVEPVPLCAYASRHPAACSRHTRRAVISNSRFATAFEKSSIGTVPIAILANAGRVAITGILSETVSPDLAHGFFHSLEGWIIFLIAFVMLLGLHAALNWAYGVRQKVKAQQ